VIWASCHFDGIILDYLPVLNPGAARGKTWIIQVLACMPIWVVVEAGSIQEALIVLSNDPEFGDWVYAGRVLDTQYVRIHGQADSDLPYAVRYHSEGYPDQGIDPRRFAAWERN
jgi:hypothetical protein